MSNHFNHLLVQHGVLVSFNIAKKMTPAQIKRFKTKILKKAKKSSDFNELLKEEIIKSTQKSINENLIPGLIQPPTPVKSDFFKDEKKILKFNFIASTFAEKLVKLGFDKTEICYIVLYILTLLGLTDDDFQNFHKNHGLFNKDGEQDGDEFDDDDEGSAL